MLDNETIMKGHLSTKYSIDMNHTISTMKSSIVTFEEEFSRPIQGFVSEVDYYRTVSAAYRIPLIKIPTFFLNSLDDPIIGKKCIDYKAIRNNENVMLGTTITGGHIGYHESIWTL